MAEGVARLGALAEHAGRRDARRGYSRARATSSRSSAARCATRFWAA